MAHYLDADAHVNSIMHITSQLGGVVCLARGDHANQSSLVECCKLRWTSTLAFLGIGHGLSTNIAHSSMANVQLRGNLAGGLACIEKRNNVDTSVLVNWFHSV